MIIIKIIIWKKNNNNHKLHTYRNPAIDWLTDLTDSVEAVGWGPTFDSFIGGPPCKLSRLTHCVCNHVWVFFALWLFCGCAVGLGVYTRVWHGVYACVCGVVLVLVFVFVRSLSARRAWEFRDSTGPPGGRARAFCLLLECTWPFHTHTRPQKTLDETQQSTDYWPDWLSRSCWLGPHIWFFHWGAPLQALSANSLCV